VILSWPNSYNIGIYFIESSSSSSSSSNSLLENRRMIEILEDCVFMKKIDVFVFSEENHNKNLVIRQ